MSSALILGSVTMLEPAATRAGSLPAWPGVPVSPGEPLSSGLSPDNPVGRSMKPEAPGPGCSWSSELFVTSGSLGPVGSVLTFWSLMFSPAASAKMP